MEIITAIINAIMELIVRLTTKGPDDDEKPRDSELHEDKSPPKEITAPKKEPEKEPEPAPEKGPEEEPKEAPKVEVAPPAEPEEEEEEEAEPEIEDPDVMLIGAWAGSAALMDPERDVQFCVKNGIGRIDIIVNDFSGERKEIDFTIRSEKSIERLVKLAKAADIETHVMSWIMPYAKHIEQAAEILVPFCNRLEIDSIQWDAEEPWTLAEHRLKYTDAAKRIADNFKDFKGQMGANAIGYTPEYKFKPLSEICDYIVPQCYSTNTSKMNPSTVVPKIVRLWRKKFGQDKRIVIGLAGYRQDKIPGYNTESALRTAFAGAQAIEGVDTTIYWSLRQIRGSYMTTKTIRSIAENTKPKPKKAPRVA